MSAPWWLTWKAVVRIQDKMGAIRQDTVILRAPSFVQAERLVLHRFESIPEIDAIEIIDLEKIPGSLTAISPFAEALKGLLDDTKCFTREGWSTVLSTDEKTLNDWVTDQALPSPENLRSILHCIELCDDHLEEPVEKWRAIVDLRSDEITPLSQEMGKRLADHLLKPVYAGFLRSLNPLDPGTQEMILLGMSEMCHTLQTRGPREWSPRMWKEWEEKMRKAIKEKRL